MEAAKILSENVSPVSSPDDDQPSTTITPDDNNKEVDTTPQVAHTEVPDSSSSPMDSHSHHDNASSSTSQVEPNNATAQPVDEFYDAPAVQDDDTLDDLHDALPASPSDELSVQENDSVESSQDSDLPQPSHKEPPEAKILATSSFLVNDEAIPPPPATVYHHRRLSSPDDDLLSSSTDLALVLAPAPRLRRLVSMDQIVAKVPSNYLPRTQSTKPSKAAQHIDLSRGQIDTAAPFESVKAAVSMFGGIVDWKAHRVQTVKRRKDIEQELEKAQEELSVYKKQCEIAEEAKTKVVEELDSTERQIEQIKLKLETTQKEEEKAKQDEELAKLKVEKTEQRIADEANITARAHLEVARVTHASAVAELNTARDELKQARIEYDSLLAEKEEAIRKAEEADAASKEAEKSIQEMTAELLVLKQSLESANAEHRAAEDRRIEEGLAKDLEKLNWEKELRWVEEDLEKLNEEMASTKDVQSKLDKTTALLQRTKAEMAAYMESNLEITGEEVNLEDLIMEPKMRSHEVIEATVSAAKKELAEVEQKIQKASDEVNTLKASATSLKSGLDEERSELAAIQQRERMASYAIRSLEAELSIVKSEITLVQMEEAREKEEEEDLPKRLQQAAQEADEAKALAQTTHVELQKVKEEAEQAKEGASAMESKLQVARNEIEAARASEKLALAAINALDESKSAKRNNNENSPDGVVLAFGEYYELTRKVHEAEERANTRLAAAFSQVEAAKVSETISLNRLEEVTREIARRKEALELALLKAEKAEAEKLAVEQELQKWKAEHEQKNKAVESVPATLVKSTVPVLSYEEPAFGQPSCLGVHRRSSSTNLKACTTSKSETESPPELTLAPKKKKRSLFPRFFMFLFKKKTAPSTKTA